MRVYLNIADTKGYIVAKYGKFLSRELYETTKKIIDSVKGKNGMGHVSFFRTTDKKTVISEFTKLGFKIIDRTMDR